MGRLRHLWFLPVITFSTIAGTFIITYIIAAAKGHTKSLWFPFLSDMVSFEPESCIFGQFIDIGAICVGFCVYFRHRQVIAYYGHRLNAQGRCWRKFSLVLTVIGMLSALGLSIIGNFQENRCLYGHLLGLMMCFGFGTIYLWGQTLFSYVMSPRMYHIALSHGRLVLCIFETLCFIAAVVTGEVAWRRDGDLLGEGENEKCCGIDSAIGSPNPKNNTFTAQLQGFFHMTDKNHPGQPLDHLHRASTTMEWMMVLFFLLYILSFTLELRYAELITPKLVLKVPTVEIEVEGVEEEEETRDVNSTDNDSMIFTITPPNNVSRANSKMSQVSNNNHIFR